MKITCSDLGKRYNREWIFRHLNYEFNFPGHYAITGPNGSGKSTLLQVIAGAVAISEGAVFFETVHSTTNTETIFKSLSFAAPYLELPEEMTLDEFFSFHQKFKNWLPGCNADKISASVGLKNALNKQIRYFSSGMKQRAKLAQAIFSETPFLFLDEPCTNLDEEGIALYNRLIKDHCLNRLVLVSSNDKAEYSFCQQSLNVLDYKE